MTIKILLNIISKEEIENIIQYYNTIKPYNFGNLDTVLCKEGGFQILPNTITINNDFISKFIKNNNKVYINNNDSIRIYDKVWQKHLPSQLT